MTVRGSGDFGPMLLGGHNVRQGMTAFREKRSAVLQACTPIGLGMPTRHQAARFRAVNSEYLSHADNGALSLGGGASFTINVWFYPEIIAGTIALVAKGDLASVGDGEYALFIEGGVLKARVSSGAGVTTVAHATGLVANRWYMGTLRYDATGPTLSVLLNAAGEVSAASVAVQDFTGSFALGANNGGADSHFTGRMQEVGLAKGTLYSLADVTWLYNVGVPRLDSTQPNGLTEIWFLDELEGNRAGAGGNTLTDNNTVTHADGNDTQATRLAAQFTAASSEYLDRADNASLSMGAGVQMTVAAWAYLDSNPANAAIAGKWTTAGNQRAYRIASNIAGNNRFTFQATPNGATATTLTADTFGAPPLGEWHFICARYDGARIYISVDNGPEDSAAYVTDIFDDTGTFELGGSEGPFGLFDGRMQAVGLWKSVLTASQRATLFNYGTPLSYSQLPTSLLSAASLVSYWNLDEASGQRNDSYSTNHLTDNNTVTNAAGKEPAPTANFQRYVFTGLRQIEIEQGGFYDDGLDALHVAMNARHSTLATAPPGTTVIGVGMSRLLSYSLAPGTATSTNSSPDGQHGAEGYGSPAGQAFSGVRVNAVEYERAPEIEGLTKAHALYTGQGEARDGIVLWPWGPRGVKTGFSGDPTCATMINPASNYTYGPVVDLGAGGASGLLHVHEDRGVTVSGVQVGFRIEHSSVASGPYNVHTGIGLQALSSNLPQGYVGSATVGLERYVRVGTLAPLIGGQGDWNLFLGFVRQ